MKYRCKYCKEKVEQLQVKIPQVCKKRDCILDYYEENQEKVLQKAKKQTEKNRKNERDKMKKNVEKLSDFEEEAKKVFQKYVRLRDKDLPCISCGNNNPADWCGSHYYPAGMYSGLIFDERNCHGACNTYCNKHLSGNLINYRKGLVNRYGEDFVLKLEEDSLKLKQYKYTREELKIIKEKYLKKIKEISL